MCGDEDDRNPQRSRSLRLQFEPTFPAYGCRDNMQLMLLPDFRNSSARQMIVQAVRRFAAALQRARIIIIITIALFWCYPEDHA